MGKMVELFGLVWKKMPKRARRWATRLAETTFTVSAAAIVTNEAGDVLLLNHLLRPNSGWGLPGGFVNAAEQPERAVRREVREETGIELRDVSLVRVRTFGRHIEIIFRGTGVGEPEVRSREITELAWFAIDDMPPEMDINQQFMIKKAIGSE